MNSELLEGMQPRPAPQDRTVGRGAAGRVPMRPGAIPEPATERGYG
ncbi:MAG TPA: hypothetical protein VLC55_11450 [Burkholderiales bacterium]|nr:hypothetical protein [Burkholderiales bacterium]